MQSIKYSIIFAYFALVNIRDIKRYYQYNKLDYMIYSKSWHFISMHYGIWDETTSNHKAALLNENKIVSEIAGINDRDVVLDIGCGYGTTAVWIAMNMGARVVGISINKKEIEAAKKLAQYCHVSDLAQFFVMDYHHIALPNKKFTVVLAIESISHSNRKSTVLSEMKRLLKQNGRLIVADGYFAKDPASLSLHEKSIADKCFRGVSIPPLETVAEFSTRLKKLKLRNISNIDFTKGILPTSKRVFLLGLLLYPISLLLIPLRISSRIGWLRISHMSAFINQYFAFNGGMGQYNITLAIK